MLYRQALSSLSVARATSLDHSLIDYLESLSTRAYFFVYGARAGLRQRLVRFFEHTWPTAVRGLWRETLASFAITAVAAIVGYLLCANDPSWFDGLVPGGLSSGRDPTATTAFLKHTLYNSSGKTSLAVLASYLFSHNAQIAIFAFALGFAFCIPTAFLLAENGLTLGAFFALFVSRGLGFQLGGWIFIHGVTELFAIMLGGAAGLPDRLAGGLPGGQEPARRRRRGRPLGRAGDRRGGADADRGGPAGRLRAPADRQDDCARSPSPSPRSSSG